MDTPTIRDVAKKAGVGIGTVSRVLNNSPKVAEKTRQIVQDAINELGFRPNSLARQLPRKTRLRNIGVITQPFIAYQAFAERMRGIQLALYELESQCEMVLYNVRSLEHFDEQLSIILQTATVEGLIVIDLDLSDEQITLLRTSNMPFVGINHFRQRDWPCIGADNVEGGRIAARYLIELGHRQIGYVGDTFKDDFGFQTSAERLKGFREVLDQAHLPLPPEYVRLGVHDYAVAKTLASELLALPNPPTAIFAMCDLQALACLDAAREAGLQVPDMLSVIGFDDLEMSHHVGLTTVRQHFERSGQMALRHLLALMHDDPPPPTPQLPALEVVERHTTRRLAD
jgi:DNA-binding LacI/PurR family transcriptional regulator